MYYFTIHYIKMSIKQKPGWNYPCSEGTHHLPYRATSFMRSITPFAKGNFILCPRCFNDVPLLMQGK